MDKFNVVICGSRTFTDYNLLKNYCDKVLINKIEQVTIITGMAKGADTLALRYAKENTLPVIKMPANWNKYGKSAGFKRNAEMVKIADAVVAFVVNDSQGTMHTVNLAKQKNIPVRVIKVVEGGESYALGRS